MEVWLDLTKVKKPSFSCSCGSFETPSHAHMWGRRTSVLGTGDATLWLLCLVLGSSVQEGPWGARAHPEEGKEAGEESGLHHVRRRVAVGQDIVLSCTRGGLDWALENNYSEKGWLDIRMSCWGRLLSPEVFKERLPIALSAVCGLVFTVVFSHKLDSIISEIFCSLNWFCDSVKRGCLMADLEEKGIEERCLLEH